MESSGPQGLDQLKGNNVHYRRWGKRALDIAASVVLLTLLSPLLLILAAATLLAHGSPVLFRQARPGLNGDPFTLLKFRTMREALDETGAPVADHLRTTRFGAFMRKSSLDELPELLNVLAGHMSLVGPRPLLIEYLPRYTSQQARRHDVRPGVTGLAQVRGRNALSWEEKFAYDLKYIDDLSFALDVGILFETVITVVKRTGVNAGENVTMPEFLGAASEKQPDQNR